MVKINYIITITYGIYSLGDQKNTENTRKTAYSDCGQHGCTPDAFFVVVVLKVFSLLCTLSGDPDPR